MSRTLTLTQMLDTHGEKLPIASPHPSPVASCRSHSLPLYTEGTVYSARSNLQFLISLHFSSVSDLSSHAVLSSMGHLSAAAFKNCVPSAWGRCFCFFFKPGVFGLSIKSTFSFWVKFTAREDKNKSLSVQLLGEYKEAWAGSGRLRLCSSFFFLTWTCIFFPNQELWWFCLLLWIKNLPCIKESLLGLENHAKLKCTW